MRLLGFVAGVDRPVIPWVTVAACVALGAAEAVSGVNLLTNPSFDGGTGGWSRYPASWPACVSTLGEGEGWAGMRLSCGVPPVEVGLRQVVPVAGGQAYRVGFRFRAAELSSSGDMTLSFRNPDGVLWQTGVEAFAGSWPWSGVSWVVQAPPAASSLEVRVGVGAGIEGEAGFDDVVLEEAGAAPPLDFTVEVGREVGLLRNLNQTNRGPVLDTRFAGIVDFSDRLAEARVTMIRGHDVHTAYDMRVLFPDPGADPSSPSSYRFATTDQAIRQALAGGFEVFFRLGESYGGPTSPRMSAAAWAEVVRRIVEHVNGDFSGGLRAGVRYWEIWNEANGPLFWSGSDGDFYDLFARAASAVKQADPTARVGGPGMAGHTDERWLRGLLRHARAAGAPVDFVSWHIYHMGSPATLARAQRQIRALVDEEGFAGAEVLLTEWNLNGGQSCEAVACRPFVKGAYNAAHLAAAVSHLQDTDLPLAFRYRTDGTEMFGLFGDGTVEPAWGRTGLAFLLLAKLCETPVRLSAAGGDGAGVTVLAGRDQAGSRLRVLIANQASAASAYRLHLVGAPARFSYTVHEIADRHPCVPGDCNVATVQEGDERDLVNGAIEVALPSPAVHLVSITAAVGTPRPPRRHLPGPGGRNAGS